MLETNQELSGYDLQDLRNDPHTIRELAKMKQEPVKTEDGRAMAEKINAFAYLECSGSKQISIKGRFKNTQRGMKNS